MDCKCGGSIREVNIDGVWTWVHDHKGSRSCPDGRGTAEPDHERN